MRAAVFQGAGKPLEIQTLTDPTPGEGQVVVKVERCGICGTDLHMTGDHTLGIPAGYIPGHEIAGEVVAVGKHVSNLKIGDRVTTMPIMGCGKCASCLSHQPMWCTNPFGFHSGGFAEYLLGGARESVKLSGTISAQDGALVEPLSVGLHGVALAQLQPGAKVLVLGPGPIGLAVIFWARRLGAGKIVVTGSSRRREDFAMTMGASSFVVESEHSGADIERALGGAPDVVFECVGKPGILQQALDRVRPRGTVISLGYCTAPDSIIPAAAMIKEIRLQFSYTYGIRDFEYCIDTLASGAVQPAAMITDTVKLQDLPEFFETMRKPGSPACKVMVAPLE
jgi:(R,R)-butanediol dehydrogenase/meso-butanediol dehydrogenase/diacetyl reductase